MAQQTIYLVRHGETEWNRERRLQGQGDSSLTELGREQARRIGLALHTTVGDLESCRIIASPLGRTLHTAEILTRAGGLPDTGIETDARLKEIAFGEWEGRTMDDIEASEAETLRRRVADPWNFTCPGGETFSDVEARLRSWLDDLPGDIQAVVIAHGESGRLLRGVYAGMSRAEVLMQDKPQDAFFEMRGGKIMRHQA